MLVKGESSVKIRGDEVLEQRARADKALLWLLEPLRCLGVWVFGCQDVKMSWCPGVLLPVFLFSPSTVATAHDFSTLLY